MGTGIVAVAAAVVPGIAPAIRPAAVVVWVLSAILLLALAALSVAQFLTGGAEARARYRGTAMAPFLGTIPMAILVVGAGTDLVGRDLLGPGVATDAHAVLWALGTALGVATAVGVPLATVLRSDIAPDQANGTWALPVVPPFVSASSAYLLMPALPAGQAQLSLLYGSYALFGMSLVAAALMIVLVWFRLVHHDAGPVGLMPTIWIVLGPFGQAATAVGTLGLVAPGVIDAAGRAAGAAGGAVGGGAGVGDAAVGAGLHAVGVLVGVPAIGFALLWTALAIGMTIRGIAQGMPFGLGWWPFTFPVGVTCTGAAAVGSLTGSLLIDGIALGYFALLVLAWGVVAARTAWASLRRGRLTLPA